MLQASSFFADVASGGVRITVSAGETLLIPGGWPHAVVTPEDSVVVGGNFLHGLDLRCQSTCPFLQFHYGTYCHQVEW